MSIRIGGGSLKGLSLSVPKGDLIRPTSVLLKRRFFDSLQNFEGMIFYDLCAGTGAMGLEACSRGAKEGVFVEESGRVFPILKKNVSLAKDRLKDVRFSCHKSCCLQFLKSIFSSESAGPGLFFFDPPYEKHDLYWKVLELAREQKWDDNQLWIESDEKKGITQEELSVKGFEPIKTFQQGDSFLVRIF